MTLTQRIRNAWNILTKAGNWEASYHTQFNRALDGSGGQPEVRNPYQQSVWVQQAIKKISQPISSVPLRFENEATEQEMEDEQLEQFWKHPARRLTYYDTIESTVGWMSLAGESFWLLGDEWLMPFVDRYEPFIVARPDKMKHVVQDGSIAYWTYTDRDGRQHNLLPEQVIQLKHWNPYDEWRGLAPYLAAQIATEADYYASLFNKNLWQQNGDRGPIISATNGIPNDAQREQIIGQLREKRAAAQRGQFKAVFLTADVKVEDPKIQTLDSNAVSVRLNNRHEIALAFGVPPSMFDVIASYSVGSASDRFVLIEETCQPLGSKIADAISGLAQRMTRVATVCAYFDWDEHSTMQAVRRERIAAATQLWQMGKPMEAINEYLQMGMKPYPGWDIGYLPFSVTPVDQIGMADEPRDPSPDDELEDEDDDEDETIGASMIRAAFQLRAPQDATEFQRNRPKREVSRWRHLAAQQAKIEKMYYTRFNRELMTARADTLARIAKLSPVTEGKSIETRAAAADIVFDLAKFKRGLLVGMRSVAMKALEEAGQTVMDELEIRDPWKTPPAEVIAFNKARENKIVGAADGVFERINARVEESIKAGDPISELADKIKGEFNDISRGRAKTIARTEAGSAYGQGRQVAMESAGVEYKQWLSSGKANVRPAHIEANGQVVKVHEKFDVGGEQLEAPGDPDGSAENVINCNCVAVAVATPEGI